MDDFTKVVRLGVQRPAWTKKGFDTFCKIEFTEGRLSITGVEGPLPSGNARGSCGQIDMHLKAEHIVCFAPGWDRAKVAKFLKVWGRYHLNDMKAGSAVQEEYLRANPITAEETAYPKSHYEVACSRLAAAGLNPDPEGYKYGSAWNREEVPEEVLQFLASLPDTDKRPAWV